MFINTESNKKRKSGSKKTSVDQSPTEVLLIKQSFNSNHHLTTDTNQPQHSTARF